MVSKGAANEPLQDALKQLQSADVIKRRIAAEELITQRNPAAAPALLQALSDKDGYVRTLAIQALGSMRWTQARTRLEQILASDTSAEVRQMAAQSLRFLSDPAAVPALSKALKDPAEAVRLTAINTMSVFKTPATFSALTEASKDKSTQVRRTALYTLGQVGDASVVPTLLAALKDTDVPIRANAAQSLGALGGKEVLPDLKAALKDPELVVQMSAARSLALRGDRSGFEAALGAANPPTGQAGRPNQAVQLLAIDTLGMIKDPAAVSTLKNLLQSNDKVVKQAAQQALDRTGQK